MPADFEMDPSPYHLGRCNVLVTDPTGKTQPCGQPAVKRLLSSVLLDGVNDQRRCVEHASPPSPTDGARSLLLIDPTKVDAP